MVLIGAYIVILIVYFFCPKAVKLVVFVINLFLPDPIPFVDEAIMVLGFFVDD